MKEVGSCKEVKKLNTESEGIKMVSNCVGMVGQLLLVTSVADSYLLQSTFPLLPGHENRLFLASFYLRVSM